MIISIGLGEYLVGRAEAAEWAMHGLGSCIGLILADRFTKVSSAAHVVLPKVLPTGSNSPARYGELVVPFLLAEMRAIGAISRRIHAQMVGGARMFHMQGIEDIGRRNAEIIKQSLKAEGIPLIAEDIGGSNGRTLRWNPQTGCARITRVGADDVILTPSTHWFADSDATCSPTG